MSRLGGATNYWVVALGLVIAGLPVGGLLAAGPTPVSLAVVLPVAVATVLGALHMACVRVRIGPDGFRIGAGPWAWPARVVPVTEILAARAERREPAMLGSPGYRERPGHVTVMVRGGECLVLELEGGRSLAVSMDGAESAVAVLLGVLMLPTTIATAGLASEYAAPGDGSPGPE